MLRLCTFLLASWFAATAIAQRSASTRAEERLVDACRAWTRAWLAGRVDLTSVEDLADAGWSRRAGITAEKSRLTPQRDLELLAGGTATLGTRAAGEALLELAAAARCRHRHRRDPGTVAATLLADQALGLLRAPAGLAVLFGTARGEAPRELAAELLEPARAAAVTALGRIGQPVFRPTLERALADPAPAVRAAAAAALALAAHPGALPALTAALEGERDAQVLAAGLQAAGTLHSAQLTPDPSLDASLAATAIRALALADPEVDRPALDLLEQARVADAVPALITLLETAAGDGPKRPDWIVARAHRLLASLTGAWFPLEQPAQWRGFWQREAAGFRVAPRPPVQSGGTSAARFFDLPATGNRIVFVVDVSGSMDFIDREAMKTAASGARAPTRLEIAKRELLACVRGLSPSTRFNLVLFSEGVRQWRQDPVPATDANKKRFEEYVERLSADSGTNLWAGLECGLRMRFASPGGRYEQPFDELFLLSDGLPTAGDVQRADEILRLATELNRLAGARIHTVYIGSVPTPADHEAELEAGMSGAELMQALAAANGGKSIVR